MAVVVGEAAVRLRPEADRFSDEAEGEINRRMPAIAGAAAGFFAAAFAAVGVGAFLGNAISEASDLSESASKVGVVFGDAADRVNAFASNASTALGQSEAQALSATGTFGNLLRSVGLTEDASADMSISMVGLASDLASFNNASPEEALEALRSGLLGEAEPLKQFGVNLNAAAIEAKAAELGLAGVGGELTDAQKAQASYAIIMEQTSLAQGDFARTSAGLANQQRIVGAQFSDLSANIGGLLVPVLGVAMGAVTGGLMPALLRLTDTLPAIGTALGSVGSMWRVGFAEGPLAVNEATAGLTGLPFIIGQVAGTAGDLGAIFRESLVDGAAGSALLAEDSLQGMAARAGEAFFQLQGTASSVWQGIATAVGPILTTLQQTFGAAFASIGDTLGQVFGGGGGGGFGAIASTISTVLETVGPLISAYIGRWADVISALVPVVVQVINALLPVIQGLFAQLGPVLAQLGPVIAQVGGVLATTLLTVLQALAPVLPVLVAAIGQVAATLGGALLTVIQALAPVLPVLVQALGAVAVTLAGALAQALAAIAPTLPVLAEAIGGVAAALAGGLAAALAALAPVLPVIADVIGQVAVALAGALAGALAAVAPILPPLAEALGQVAAALAGALAGALQALLPVLPPIIDAFLQLVMAVLPPLLPLLPVLAGLIATIVAAAAPLIPPIVQIVALLVQLAVQAIVPLMPVITLLINLFVGIVSAIAPIIGIGARLIGFFLEMGYKIVATVLGMVTGVIGFFVSLPGKIVGGLASLGSKVVQVFTTAFTWLGRTVGSGIDNAIDFFRRLPGRILSALGSLGSLLLGAGGDLIRGLVNGISAAAGFVGDVAGSIWRAIKGFVNSQVIDRLNGLLEFTIAGVHIDVPDIPRLHSGGVYSSGTRAGEGLAVLRDDELVATPEQRAVADNLLRELLAGRLPDAGRRAGPPAAATSQVSIDVHPSPGMDERLLAAHVANDVGWQVASGATRPVPLLGAGA